MAKFYGNVGYAVMDETVRGVSREQIIEKPYYGDLIRNTRRLESSSYLNDNITISNEISIVADPFAYENFHMIRYVVFMGVKWKISNIDIQYPRIILTTGGVYNE